MNRSQISNIWLTDTSVWIELNDGRKAEEKFSDYKRLAAASKEQRQNYRLSYFGIHWPEKMKISLIKVSLPNKTATKTR